MAIKLCLYFCLGALVALGCAGLDWLLIPPVLAALVLIGCAGRNYGALAAFVGCAYFSFYSSQQLAQTLPLSLDKSRLTAVVRLADIPRYGIAKNPDKYEFILLEDAYIQDFMLARGARLRVSDYSHLRLRTSASWQLELILRSPRSLVNPAGFDYRRWLLGRGISATGYVVADADNQSVHTQRVVSVTRLRVWLAGKVRDAIGDSATTALVLALTLGDDSGFTQRHRDVLQGLGLSHLFVVSGLHIGLMAAIGLGLGRLCASLLWRPLIGGANDYFEVAGATLLALSYAVLAGLSLPTQRALVMIGVLLFAHIYRRFYRVSHALILAAALIVLLDPLALLSVSFWLSFGAVAALLVASRSANWLRSFCVAQLSIFVILTPLLSLFGLPVAPLAPLINVVAIPLVSLVLVPASLIGVGFASVDIVWPLRMVGRLFELCWWLANAAHQLVDAGVALYAPVWAIALALLSAALAAWRRRLWPLALCTHFILWLPVTTGPRHPAVYVFDVGQGLSVLVVDADRALLFDTGAAYRSGFNLAEAVLIPSLRSLGVRKLDVLVISHSDNDHAGGVRDIIHAFEPSRLYSPQSTLNGVEGFDRCVAGSGFTWQRIQFEFLTPVASGPVSSNDSSCVLKLSIGTFTALLPGDISSSVELALSEQALRGVNLLVAPHHGSRSSSSAYLLDTAQPDYVVVSAGFNNAFKHPHPDVVARYEERGIEVLNTALTGAVVFRLSDSGELIRLERYRDKKFGFWH